MLPFQCFDFLPFFQVEFDSKYIYKIYYNVGNAWDNQTHDVKIPIYIKVNNQWTLFDYVIKTISGDSYLYKTYEGIINKCINGIKINADMNMNNGVFGCVVNELQLYVRS